MPGLSRQVARRWYVAGIGLSGLALVFAVLSHIQPRIGYPLAFTFTMFGLLAITRPSWDLPNRRVGVVVVNTGALLTQVAILVMGMNSASS